MSIKSLTNYDVNTFRSIVFHGKNSMTNMHLMMIGSTPLSQVTPKIVREEVAYGDGDLDLSMVDGGLYFNTRTITYSFVVVDEDNYPLKPVDRNKSLTYKLNEIYEWLYKEFSSGTITYNSNQYTIASTELYDYGYGAYKFTNASVTDMQVSKAMVGGDWLETLEITFTCDPYQESLSGERIELATYVDRSITGRNVQTAMMIYTNNRYWLNDFYQWFSKDNASRLDSKKWRFRIRVPFAGVIGFRLAPSCTLNETTYEINTAYGQTTTLYFLDNDHPGETITSHKGGWGYTQPVADSNGYLVVDFVVDFVETWTPENPPWIVFEWGVLRNYSVPDQSHYIVNAYTKSDTAKMYVNAYETAFDTPFALPVRPISEIHIRNTDFDGMYKWIYQSANYIRRL